MNDARFYSPSFDRGCCTLQDWDCTTANGFMVHLRVLTQSLGVALILLAMPALAHTVKVASGVAATFHIEPNHTPKVGTATLAWFALTQRGGKLIPLSQCNCQLTVYSQPRSRQASPVLKPALKTVNVEKYKGVLGASITFPKAGAYELELAGTAKAPATFKPFKLTYRVTAVGR